MIDVLNNLEPIAYPKRKVIYNELDESDMIYFFVKG